MKRRSSVLQMSWKPKVHLSASRQCVSNRELHQVWPENVLANQETGSPAWPPAHQYRPGLGSNFYTILRELTSVLMLDASCCPYVCFFSRNHICVSGTKERKRIKGIWLKVLKRHASQVWLFKIRKQYLSGIPTQQISLQIFSQNCVAEPNVAAREAGGFSQAHGHLK